jgi:hypothetical protein
MSEKSDYHEAQVMDRIFANSAPDGAVDGCYVMLWASTPTNNPDSSNELSGDSYSAVQVTASGWSVSQANDDRIYDNDNAINFGQLDTSNGKTIEGIVLYDGADASTANALWVDKDFGSTSVLAGDKFEIESGDMTVKEG